MNTSDEPLQLPESPFPGILPFSYAQRDVFFDRDSEARSLARLAVMYRGVLLYADSGTGKSSLVDAGLIPGVLEDGFQPERVRIRPVLDQEIIIKRISLNPGGGPPYLPSIFSTQDELDQVVLSIDEFLGQVRRGAASAHPMLIFDQFEEWVTLFEEESSGLGGDVRREIHNRLAEAIAGLILEQSLPVKVVIVFREDYLAKMDALFRLCPQLPDQYLRLGHLHSDQIAALIRRPYEKYPGQFKPEISASLAGQIQEQFIERSRGADPFLTEVQIVCQQLFSSGKDGDDLEAYFQEAGGVGGIVEDYFETALASLDEALRDPAVGLLTRMVTSAGTRNVISEDDLIYRVKQEDDTPESLLTQALAALEQKTGFIRHDLRRDTDYYELGSEFLVDWIVKKRAERLRLAEQKKLAQAQKEAEAERAQAEKFRKLYNLSVSQGLAAKALISMEVDQERSLLLAVEGVLKTYLGDKTVTPEAENALRRAILECRIKRTLIHPYDVVTSVAFSPDGSTLATGCEDCIIRLWDVFTGEMLKELTGHTNWVLSLAYHPQKGFLASASGDRTVKIWDPATGNNLFSGEHPAGLRSVVFSLDGKRMATGGDQGIIKLWDTADWLVLRSLSADEETGMDVWDISFSPDGKYLASVGLDMTIRLWDVETGNLQFTMLDDDEIYGVAFSPDGLQLATCGRSNTASVKLWDLTERKLSNNLLGQFNTANRVIFSPDGSRLAAVSYDRTTKVWEASTGAVVMTFTGHDAAIRDVDFSPNGLLLATAAEDGTARIWDFSQTQELITLPVNNVYIYHFSFSNDGSRLALPQDNGSVHIHDLRTGIMVHRMLAHDAKVAALVYSPDGNYLATASQDQTVKLWDARKHTLLHTFTGYSSGIRDLEFDAQCAHLATVTGDGHLVVWDVKSKQSVFDIDAHSGEILGVTYSPDGRKLVTVGEDSATYLWDAHTGDSLKDFSGYRGRMLGACFSRDGKLLFTSGDDNSIWVWNLRSGTLVKRLIGHLNIVDEIVTSPDGNFLASAGWDRTSKIWDLTTGNELITLYGHVERVNSVVYSSDGRLLATTASDNTARVYTLEIERLLSLAWSRLTRSLGKEECRKYLQEKTVPDTVKAIGWIVKGRQQAGVGDLVAATASLKRAFKLLPGIKLEPGQEARRMAADIQLEKGRWQAANNNYQNAMSHFKEAIGLDANITIDAEFAVATLISESLVDSGSRKALRGEVSAALSDLKQAKGYPIAQSNEMLYQKLIQVLMKLAQDGEINAALDLLDGVPELDLGMELPAMVWNLVCWAGSTRGNASRVLFAGEKAVQIDPDPNYYDSRGLARALTGDIPGAIEDFQVFIADCEATEQFLNLAEQRKFWINELQAGRNPFDEATLRSLR